MNIGAFERHGVKVERKFSAVPLVRVDKFAARCCEILINLIRNAKMSLDEVERADKTITLSVFAINERAVHIVVADNGIGIPPENSRAFSRTALPRAKKVTDSDCIAAQTPRTRWAARFQ